MATTAEKNTRLERLKKMRDSGVSSTSHDGVTTSFRSMSDLTEAITRLERELGRRPRDRSFMQVFMGHR